MDWKKIIIAGIAAGLVILVISQIVDFAVKMIWPYDIFSLGGMRSMEDPLMLAFFLHSWVLSFAAAIFYSFVGDSFKGHHFQKGKKFGFLLWLVAGLPSAFIVYTSMNYPLGFHVSGLVGSLLYSLAAGITIAKLME